MIAMISVLEVLMYDNKLDASITNFEGIFGLGLPYKSRSAGEQSWLTTASWCLIGFLQKLLVTSWWFQIFFILTSVWGR